MITLNIKPLLLQKGYKPTVNRLFKFGIGRSTAKYMLAGNLKAIKLDDLEQLCIMLNCTPKEILKVTIKEGDGIGEHHPYFAWSQTITPQPMQDIFGLSPEQLLKLSEVIQVIKNEK